MIQIPSYFKVVLDAPVPIGNAGTAPRAELLALIGLLVVVMGACTKKSEAPSMPKPAIASEEPKPALAKADPVAVVIAAPATPAVALPTAVSGTEKRSCEVEIGGKFEGPRRTASEDYYIYFAIGDCLDANAKMVYRGLGSEEGNFFGEVFVPCGVDLTVCGSLEPRSLETNSKPTTRYGKVDKSFHAEGVGEIEFRNLIVPLKPNAEKRFPQAHSAL